MTSLRSDGSVEFRFYRPQATDVKVSGDFNGWSHDVGAVRMRKLEGGWWAAEAKLDAGEYRFRYLADGHTDAWLQAIDRAEEALASVRTLYVGHGASTEPAVLAEQRRYLLTVREAIGRVGDRRAELSVEEANRVVSLMERYAPSAPLSWLVGAGASAVAAELAQDAATE